MSAMRIHNVIFFVLLFLSVSVLTDALKREVLVGGWTPIKNITDPHVAEIAEFAVTEYDKQSGKNLKLVKVIKGETQVVSGTNYRLLLTVKNESVTKNYTAQVLEKSWIHFKNLTSFKPLLLH